MIKDKFKNKKKFVKKCDSDGFTLIEVTIYIALFAFIMTGTIMSVYSILSSNARNQGKAMVQEEGSFLLGKIDWALSGVKISSSGSSSITLPSSGANGSTLLLTKSDGTNIKINMDSTGNNLEIDRGSGPSILNNSNVAVSRLSFTHESGTGDGINPENLEAKFTVSAKTSEGLSFSQDFSTIKYLRK